MGEVGFEPTKAKPTDLQSVLVDHLSIRPEMSAASERCSDAGWEVYRRSGSAAILGSGGNLGAAAEWEALKSHSLRD